MNDRRWWRVEVDAEGKAHSVTRVDAKPEHPGCGVLYVLAVDGWQARQEAHRLAQRLRQRERTEQYQREGKCRCGRPRETEHRLCATCRERLVRDKQRSQLRASGGAVDPISKVQAHAERRTEERDRIRAELMRELLEELREKRTIGEAIRWLRAKILAATHRSAA